MKRMKRRLRPWVKVTLGVLWLSALTKAAACQTVPPAVVNSPPSVSEEPDPVLPAEPLSSPLWTEDRILCTPKIIKEVKLL